MTKKNRFTTKSEIYLPFYPGLIDIRNKHERAHWIKDEAPLRDDIEQWKSGVISPEEKNLIRNILLLFTQSDLNVGAGYIEKLIPFFKNNECRLMLLSFASREGEHQIAYAALNDTLGMGEESYNEFLQYSEMKEKHEFMIEDIDDDERSILAYLAKQSLMEGVSLFASFAILLNFDRFGKLKGVSDIVKWSMRDESIHVEGNATLFAMYHQDRPGFFDDAMKAEIIDSCERLIKLEDVFIDKAFEMGGVDGLEPEEVKLYVRYVADYRMYQLGIDTNYGPKENPLPWVDELMAAINHSNFFERIVTDYSKDPLTGDWSDGY